MAAVVARAVVVDVAKGDLLAKVMSIMMALGGLAPMVAPVLGGAVLTLGGTWRTVFWVLVGFGLLMMITAIAFVPESLPPERRHGGGLRQFATGLREVVRIRLFVGYMLTAALSGFTMMAYIANSSYVLQEQKGLQPMPFALFFAAPPWPRFCCRSSTPRSSDASGRAPSSGSGSLSPLSPSRP